ncbi:MAG TPA: DUF2156 domain-containing protein [Planctomycetaceae bacterium]|jgi:lysylphosphatidylglycerol synthetase-like protein (DUF2156 family)|nr:DUF2156 domain-containing protein [Planctomycetaceae bacterium]
MSTTSPRGITPPHKWARPGRFSDLTRPVPKPLSIGRAGGIDLAPLQVGPVANAEWSRDRHLVSSAPAIDSEAPDARRYEMLRQSGNFTMAFATLQPGMKYFEAHDGYVAYDTYWGINFVLGDPVAPLLRYSDLIGDFLKQHPRSCFCQISAPVGAILARHGYFVNEFGSDIELYLPSYDFEGPKKSKFRQAAHKIERESYTIEEGFFGDADHQAIEALSSSWRSTKTVKQEARFLVRPLAFGDEPDVRKVCLRAPDGHIAAFVVFDPIYEDGQVVGYSPAIKRRASEAPTGAEEAITKFAIERFRDEGMTTFRLGLLPLHNVEKSAFRDSRLLRAFFQWLYCHGDRCVYSFRGHADFKHRYRGSVRKVYFGTYTSWGNTLNLIALMRLCRFV